MAAELDGLFLHRLINKLNKAATHSSRNLENVCKIDNRYC
jgi:hypothetical protein